MASKNLSWYDQSSITNLFKYLSLKKKKKMIDAETSALFRRQTQPVSIPDNSVLTEWDEVDEACRYNPL